jgi:hypothetical protein
VQAAQDYMVLPDNKVGPMNTRSIIIRCLAMSKRRDQCGGAETGAVKTSIQKNSN